MGGWHSCSPHHFVTEEGLRERDRETEEREIQRKERESENAHSQSVLRNTFQLLATKFHCSRVVSEVPAVLVASCHLVRAVTMSWTVNPEWKPEDIFKLSKMELERLKLHVAKTLECKYRNVGGAPFNWAYAQDAGGRAAFTESGAEAAIETYIQMIDNKPTESQGESEEAFKKKRVLMEA